MHPVHQESIVIERREIVAELPLTTQDGVNPLTEAYARIGEVMSEAITTSNPSTRFEFTLGGQTFTASSGPIGPAFDGISTQDLKRELSRRSRDRAREVE